MINEENPITEVPEDSCWGYLDTAEVGRLATSVNDQPEVFPSTTSLTDRASSSALLLVANWRT